MNRKELIEELADDITSGIPRYLSMADIVDCMMDQGSLDPDTVDRKSTRLNSSHVSESRMPSSA